MTGQDNQTLPDASEPWERPRAEKRASAVSSRAWVHSCRFLPWLLFAMFAFRELELPGLYMDEINHAAFAPAIVDKRAADKPHYRLPDNILGDQSRYPILGGSVYNSVIDTYLAIPMYQFLGFTLVTHRLWEITMCAGLLLLFQLLAYRLFQAPLVACAVTSCLAIDPLFIFQVRSNAYLFVLMLVGVFGVLLGLHHCWRNKSMPVFVAVTIALGTGVALSSYWVAGAVLAVPFLAATYLAQRYGRLTVLIIATVVFMLPYVYALLSIYLQAPQRLAHWGMPQFAINAQSQAPLSMPAKLGSAGQEYLSYLGAGHYFGPRRPLTFTGVSHLKGGTLKAAILLSAVALVIADVFVRIWRGDQDKDRVMFMASAVAAPLLCFWILLIVFASVSFHHLLTTLPFVYLALGYVCDRAWSLLRGSRASLQKAAALALPVIMLAVSFTQQEQVIAALRRTGGVGVFSERISQIPVLSSQYYPRSLLVFPDWGFHLPFLYLTAGKVPYAAPFGDPHNWMKSILPKRKDIVICATPPRTETMQTAIRGAGGISDVRPIKGRDGRLIFNFIHATMPPADAIQPPPEPAR